MADEAIITPVVEETIPTTEATVETIEETPEETPIEVEKTMSEMILEEEERPNMVPEGVFLEQKKARKALERELSDLKAKIKEGASTEETYDNIDAIADEYDVDKDFIKKLSSTIKSQAKSEMQAEMSAKSEQENSVKKFDDAFNKQYQTALDRGPEFKEIVNADVVKQLALLPQNAKKTISQILEETYGNAIQGKRTIETTTPGGGKDPEPLDYEKAQKDISYYKEVMADPKRKAEYNELSMKKGF